MITRLSKFRPGDFVQVGEHIRYRGLVGKVEQVFPHTTWLTLCSCPLFSYRVSINGISTAMTALENHMSGITRQQYIKLGTKQLNELLKNVKNRENAIVIEGGKVTSLERSRLVRVKQFDCCGGCGGHPYAGIVGQVDTVYEKPKVITTFRLLLKGVRVSACLFEPCDVDALSEEEYVKEETKQINDLIHRLKYD